MIFPIRQSIQIQTGTNIVLNDSLHSLLQLPMMRGCLAQYFYSINGRIQCLHHLQVTAGL